MGASTVTVMGARAAIALAVDSINATRAAHHAWFVHTVRDGVQSTIGPFRRNDARRRRSRLRVASAMRNLGFPENIALFYSQTVTYTDRWQKLVPLFAVGSEVFLSFSTSKGWAARNILDKSAPDLLAFSRRDLAQKVKPARLLNAPWLMFKGAQRAWKVQPVGNQFQTRKITGELEKHRSVAEAVSYAKYNGAAIVYSNEGVVLWEEGGG